MSNRLPRRSKIRVAKITPMEGDYHPRPDVILGDQEYVDKVRAELAMYGTHNVPAIVDGKPGVQGTPPNLRWRPVDPKPEQD